MPYYSNQRGYRACPPNQRAPQPQPRNNDCCREETACCKDTEEENCFLTAVADVKKQPSGCDMYELEVALVKGTIYPALDKPFLGRRVC